MSSLQFPLLHRPLFVLLTYSVLWRNGSYFSTPQRVGWLGVCAVEETTGEHGGYGVRLSFDERTSGYASSFVDRVAR